MSKGACEDEELDEEQQDQSLPLRCLMSSEDGKVVRRVHQHSEQDLPRYLDNDVGDDEGGPAVGFAGPFPHFVEGALLDDPRLDLLHEARHEGGEHENAEDDVLESLLGRVFFVEGEADEEG